MFGLGVGDFDGFVAADFDAFEEKKWSSNRYNLERMRVRNKLQALEAQINTRFEAAGVAIQSDVTLDHPTILNNKKVDAIWLTFSRTEEQRRALSKFIEREIPLADRVQDADPRHQHLHLGVRVGFEGVEVGLTLHRHAVLDVRNLIEKSTDAWEGENLRAVYAALPEDVSFRVGDDERRPAADLQGVSAADLRARFDAGAERFSICRRYEREDELPKDASFVDALLDGLNRLLPIYRYAVWQRENDFLSMQKLIKEERRADRAAAAGGQTQSQAAKPKAASSSAPSGRAPKAVRAAGPLKKGDKVRVSAGLFHGKQGTVTEIDNRGRIKVFLGKLSVTLTAKELQRA